MTFIFQAVKRADAVVLLPLVALAGGAFFGANNPLFSGAMASVCGALLMLSGTRGPALPRWLSAGWAVLMLWGLTQILPLPSPLAVLMHPLQSATHTISLTPQSGLLALLNGGLYTAGFFLAWKTGASDTAARQLLKGLALAALFIALNGLLMHLTGTQAVLWQTKKFYLHDLTATFINRNSYATFAGLGTLACLGAALLRIGEIPGAKRAPGWQRVKALQVLVLKPGRWWFGFAFLIFVTLLLSHSRGGLLACGVGLMVFYLALVFAARGARVFLLTFLPLLLGFGVVVMNTAGQETLERLGQGDAGISERQAIYAITWKMTQALPLTGSGLGSFEAAFRLYRTPQLPLAETARVDHAHNSWLEFAVEMGWPATALLATLTIALAALFVRGLSVRRNGVAYPALGLSALLLVTTHAWVDFSLNIPAVTFCFSVLLGLCATQSLSRSQREIFTTNRLSVIGGLALTVMALMVTIPSLSVWRGAHILAQVRAGEPVPESSLQHTRNDFNQALRWWNYAEWRRELGLLDMLLAHGDPVLLAAARQNLLAAVQIQPADPYSWQRLALLEPDRETAATYLYNSLVTGPAEPNLLKARLPQIRHLHNELFRRDADLVEQELRLTAGPPSAY
jgi:hypothetical protein